MLLSLCACDFQTDRHILDLLRAIGAIHAHTITLSSSLLSNLNFKKLVAKELLSNRHMGTVGLGDSLKRFGNWLTERGQKTAPEADFTATGSFSGDLLEVLKNPESYLIKAMQTFASQNPLVKAAFEARDFGIAIGTAIETSLKFDNIAKGMGLTIKNIKAIEETYKTSPIGQSGDVRKMTVAGLDKMMYLSGVISHPNQVVAKTIVAVMQSVRTATKIYVANKVIGLIGGTLTKKLFPGETGLINWPKTYKEWLDDFGRTAMNEIQKKVEMVATAKL